jgi:hypothetical protein
MPCAYCSIVDTVEVGQKVQREVGQAVAAHDEEVGLQRD